MPWQMTSSKDEQSDRLRRPMCAQPRCRSKRIVEHRLPHGKPICLCLQRLSALIRFGHLMAGAVLACTLPCKTGQRECSCRPSHPSAERESKRVFHMPHRKSKRSVLAGLSLVPVLLILGGCGGPSLTHDFQVPADERASITSAGSTEQVFRIPGDIPFNITSKRSDQVPGMEGTARGESGAEEAGTAFCRVSASDGGSASASFELGHCVENRGSQPATAEAVFVCEYEGSLSETEDTETNTTTTYALDLYINDTDGRVLKHNPFEAASGDEGPRSGSTRFVEEYVVTLEPGRVYNFVVAGKVAAKTGLGGKADLKIEVKTLQLTIRKTAAE